MVPSPSASSTSSPPLSTQPGARSVGEPEALTAWADEAQGLETVKPKVLALWPSQPTSPSPTEKPHSPLAQCSSQPAHPYPCPVHGPVQVPLNRLECRPPAQKPSPKPACLSPFLPPSPMASSAFTPSLCESEQQLGALSLWFSLPVSLSPFIPPFSLHT